jgi:4-alpha-glucanotransferase
MGKDVSREFDSAASFPYLAVCCPATHDMTTLRAWWEENRVMSAHFWASELGRKGSPPEKCDPWLQEEIIRQHLASNAMWAIFLVQDLTGIAPSLRRQKPEEERINDPSNPHQIWSYRLPFTIQEAIDETDFTERIRAIAEATHRL